MSRQDEFKTTTNPATHYLAWKSNDSKFESYDKGSKEKELINLPFEFTVLKVGSAIGGWSSSQDTTIYSNIITNSSKQDLQVKRGKSKWITGKYKEIRDEVLADGGHYETKIFCIHNGNVVILTLKGSALSKWFELLQKSKAELSNRKVIVKTFESGKKGSIKYTMPIFELSGEISPEESKTADTAYDTITEFLTAPIETEEPEEDISDSKDIAELGEDEMPDF